MGLAVCHVAVAAGSVASSIESRILAEWLSGHDSMSSLLHREPFSLRGPTLKGLLHVQLRRGRHERAELAAAQAAAAAAAPDSELSEELRGLAAWGFEPEECAPTAYPP